MQKHATPTRGNGRHRLCILPPARSRVCLHLSSSSSPKLSEACKVRRKREMSIPQLRGASPSSYLLSHALLYCVQRQYCLRSHTSCNAQTPSGTYCSLFVHYTSACCGARRARRTTWRSVILFAAEWRMPSHLILAHPNLPDSRDPRPKSIPH